MKLKYAIAAAAVLAASAQAGYVQSDTTYVVITLPVAQGYNFYGVAVQPLTEQSTYAQVFGVENNAEFLNGAGESSNKIYGDDPAVFSTPLWYENKGETAGTIYQIGVDNSAAEVEYVVKSGETYPLAITKDMTLDSFTSQLSENSYQLYNKKANAVSVWDASSKAYQTYFYNPKKNSWQNTKYKDVTASEISIPAGKAVYVQISTESKLSKITL